jgi:hypothetical protein
MTGWPLPDHAPLASAGSIGDRAAEPLSRIPPSATWKRESDIPWEREARVWEALDPV